MVGRKRRRRRAFTLLELLFAMVAMTALMGGLASALMLASRAIPDDASPAAVAIDAYYAADQIAGELFCAQSFSERTATAITFTVADRDNDTIAETIRYAWSGTPGDPLTRQYNAAAAVAVVDDVREFEIQYEVKMVTQASPPDLFYLTGVRIVLRIGGDTSTRVDTAVQVLNAPEVSGP
ncbi:MAG: prepilin-type N-terminal cleavage/methylation domain-containing protein [Planctomycetes bacterium]|nr:prepilin-type N-terminal cleavage/methylation domain-containing protein [Planctomycetota bacterium]